MSEYIFPIGFDPHGRRAERVEKILKSEGAYLQGTPGYAACRNMGHPFDAAREARCLAALRKAGFPAIE